MNMVQENKERYTRNKLTKAEAARSLYIKLGYPVLLDFYSYLDRGFIRNSPITSQDGKRAIAIYGPKEATLKGRMVKVQNLGIPSRKLIFIPAPILEQYP